jgi:O-acetyl-ADP-ribose deacetylase (regulator of RNase III)
VAARLSALQGDITRQPTDAVVNAANEALARGSGVCGAIFAAAGPGLADACAAVAPCRTGDAVATPGLALPARWIIHAVGPVWHDGARGEAELLAGAYRRSLEVAAGLGATSISFPAISTGVYGYPLEAATAVAVSTCRDAPPEIELIQLVCFDSPTLEVYERALTTEDVG